VRVLDTARPPDGPLEPVPPDKRTPESIAVTWCREIATSVAGALDTDVGDLGYRLARHPDAPLPRTLHTAFTTIGPCREHIVRIAVVWDDPWREPGFALTVDDQVVALDADSGASAAVVLAYAAWQAIADLDAVAVSPPTRPAGYLATPAGHQPIPAAGEHRGGVLGRPVARG